MRKILIFAVVLALLAPAAALAATEFTLGGFIKLDTFWDSTQESKNINTVPARNNDTTFHHGQFRMTAQGSRFNFTIKGPEVLGAKLTGFIEMDFDSCTDVGSIPSPGAGAGYASQSNNYVPRLRHAMFRLNWPGDTELMFGQYWSMFCDWFPEAAEDGPFQLIATPTARIPQIRFTQGFLGDWHVAGLVGLPNGYTEFGSQTMNPYGTSTNAGVDAETPQIQGQVKYSHDWWGKAAFYGNPIPFTASVTAGWQRLVERPGEVTIYPITSAPPLAANATSYNVLMWHDYFSPWMVQGALFLPIIPTHTNNLAGTAHLLVVPFIGQGTNEFGLTGDSTGVFKFTGYTGKGLPAAEEELLKGYGLMAEAQYYFTNEWFINAAYGIHAYMDINKNYTYIPGLGTVQQYGYNYPYNQPRSIQQVDATLWWQPVKALKFGIQYTYLHEQFLVNAFPGVGGAAADFGTSGKVANMCDEHRIEFAGFFFF